MLNAQQKAQRANAALINATNALASACAQCAAFAPQNAQLFAPRIALCIAKYKLAAK